MKNILMMKRGSNFLLRLVISLLCVAVHQTAFAQTQQEIYQKMIEIVVTQSQAIAAVGVAVDIQERKKVWESEARLLGRYADNASLDTPGGLSYKGELAFKYPLFADEKTTNVAEAKAKALVVKEQVISEFVSKLEEVGKMCMDWQIALSSLDLALQEASRVKAGVENQVFPSDALAGAIEKSQAKSGEEYKARGILRGRVIGMSLQFGGEQHNELRPLVVQYTNMGYGACDPFKTQSVTPVNPAPVPDVGAPPAN